jgi:hypothetical protein
MGLNVVLETEEGLPVEEVEDPSNLLHRFLPTHDDFSYQWLRYIDRYGHTVFNRLQIMPFLAEWERLHSVAESQEEKELLLSIETLARRCQSQPRLYLKFQRD